ncbi:MULTISPECIES: hypothetical protein [unclassified Pseudomonas]|uniref:hypothetical protein n=1 Tax=unclassified Pseudomonas TaxID=196821 RepID=UPI00244BA26F|nr:MULTISPECIES: hypothetical protein [unclassified Pseudomonas]MDG9927073.1 hypothetical protein [Pseudomonas sp. GD04042]MDH0482918.1 hypothetical protein [Pseudomonas sp. GD04015]MDH0602488.1 hypothetical protein [Pseudomonas sp. GD03869]
MQNNTACKVAWWVRLLAIALLCVQLFIAGHVAISLIDQRTLPGDLLAEPLDALLLVFINLLFAFVALTGRSPAKLFPVANLDLRPFFRRSH